MDFNTIRINNYKSQNNAFEQLCCQLFYIYGSDRWKDAEFIRKNGAGGDAGVECYWKLKSGEEYGLQAKFSDKLNNLWQQIDESVKTALEKHPKLVKYYVCTPFDRTDMKKKKQKSDIDKWTSYTKNWKTIKNIEFIWWGKTELEHILCLDNPYSYGLYEYWFDDTLFNSNWFESYKQKVICNSGPRYNSELNIKTDSNDLIEDILRTEKSLNKKKEQLLTLRDNYKRLFYILDNQKVNKQYHLDEKFDNLYNILEKYIYDGVLDDEIYNTQKNIFQEQLLSLSNNLHNCVIKDEKENDAYHYFSNIQNTLDELFFYIKRTQYKNYLIKGDAGTGKTHLLCDIYNQSVAKKEYISLICMAHTFKTNSDLITEILQNIGDFKNMEQLLGALNAFAVSRQQIACLIIDGINEWYVEKRENIYHQIDILSSEIAKYSNLKLIISCRTEYYDEIKKYLQMRFYEIEHRGFRNNSIEALMQFCDYYKIKIPSMPLLCVELYNPLILKTLCETYKNKGEFPKEMTGIYGIFDSYLNYLNEFISENLDIDKSDRKVIQTIDKIAELMYQNHSTFVNKQKIKETTSYLNISSKWSENILFHLIKESFLIDIDENYYISYEKYRDYLIVRTLFTKCDEMLQSERSIFLKANIDNFTRYFFNLGILGFICISLPEKYGIEIFDLYKNKKVHEIFYNEINRSFFYSLSVRNPKSITQNTMYWITNLEKRDWENIKDIYWKGIINCALLENHPLNVEYLHEKLSKLNMVDIDASWTQFISLNFDKDNNNEDIDDYFDIKNIISPYLYIDNYKLPNDSIYKISTLFLWFTVTTDRALRNYATLAIVNLLIKREDILLDIYLKFRAVSDIFLQERLYQIIYSVCLFSDNKQIVNHISHTVYENIFNSDIVFPNIIIRYYAAKIIKYSEYLGNDISEFETKHLPPYDYPLITEYPSKDEIEASFSVQSKEYSKREKSYSAIYFSSICDDFNHYTLNSVCRWYDCLFNAPLQVKEEQMHIGELFDLDDDAKFKKCQKQDYTKTEKTITSNFRKEKAAYWICKRAYELGWDENKHGVFDDKVGRHYDRQQPLIERIGKKYQWIAYREFLCNLADNYRYRGYSSGLYKLDISDFREFLDLDATFLLEYNNNDNYEAQFNSTNDFLDKSFIETNLLEQENWLNNIQEDICYGEKMIEYTKNGISYVKLYDCARKVEKDIYNRLSPYRRDFYISEKAYLIKKDDIKQFKKYLEKRCNNGSNGFDIFCYEDDLTDCDIMEYPTFYKDKKNSYIFNDRNDLCACDINAFSCTLKYYNEINNQESIQFHLPSYGLINLFNLNISKNKKYEWLYNGEPLIFNEIVNDKKSDVLLADKTKLIELINQTDWKLIFIINTEKRLYTKSFNNDNKYPYKYYTTVYQYNEKGNLKRIFNSFNQYPNL